MSSTCNVLSPFCRIFAKVEFWWFSDFVFSGQEKHAASIGIIRFFIGYPEIAKYPPNINCVSFKKKNLFFINTIKQREQLNDHTEIIVTLSLKKQTDWQQQQKQIIISPPQKKKNCLSCSSHKFVRKLAYLSLKMTSLDQKDKIMKVANIGYQHRVFC